MRLQPLFLALCAALNRVAPAGPWTTICCLSTWLQPSASHCLQTLRPQCTDCASPLCSSKRGEPVVYESIGNGVDSKQITPKDDATVKCICGTCDDDGERMVCCDKCQNWLHTRCIGLDDGKEIPPDFSLTQFLRVK